MNVKITAIRKANYQDLQAKYENPIEHTCDVRERLGVDAMVCAGAGGRSRQFLRWLDEKPEFGDD